MTHSWRSKNAGLCPQDPAYREDYDEEEDEEAFLKAMEDRTEL